MKERKPHRQIHARTRQTHAKKMLTDHEQIHAFIPPLKPGDPGPKVSKKIKPNVNAVFLSKDAARVKLMAARNPRPKGSFGYIGRFVSVQTIDNSDFPSGTLAISFDRSRLGSIAKETLRVFHWDEEAKAYRLVYRSGIGQTRDYVWAKISRPGIYAVIGVNADPLVARTLGLLLYLHGWLHVGVAGQKDRLHERICKLILCNPEMQKLVQTPEFARRLTEDNLRHGLPGRWPGRLSSHKAAKHRLEMCEVCQSPELPRQPPEAELISLNIMTPTEGGQWEVLSLGPQEAQILAVHAALLRTGKVLYFSGDEHDQNLHDTGDVNHTRLWDPATNTIESVASPVHDLFCCGHAFLGNGKLLVAGGTQQWAPFKGLRKTTIFNPIFGPTENPWKPAALMLPERGKSTGGGRWYPTLVTLSTGRILAMSGYPEVTDTRPNNIMLEVYKPSPTPLGTWMDQGDRPDAPDSYPRLHLLPDGQVFCVSYMSGQSHKWNPNTGVWTSVATAPAAAKGFVNSSVLLPLSLSDGYKARVLLVGDPKAKIINLDAVTPVWQNTSDRDSPYPVRRYCNAVLLPDATVLVVGGAPVNDDDTAVLKAELYNPVTNDWSTLANAAVPRLYHSVALLLPDGRVWTAGSNKDCKSGVANRELRMEVFSPPYLFKGPRPTISSAPVTVTLSSIFDINTPQANSISSVAILRCGSVTHSFDADQRYVGLTIQGHTSTKVTVASPPNHNVAPPGYYLLFLIDNAGVPSTGHFIKI